MTLAYDRDAKIRAAIIPSTDNPDQLGIVALNHDGSSIGGGGGGGDMNLIQVGGFAIALGQAIEAASIPVVLASDVDLEVSVNAGAMQSLSQDDTGQDAYATVKTPAANASHILISLTGANAAIVSLDAGVTDHIFVPGSTVIALDNLTITSGVAIQAKNAVGGSNYTGLSISIW
jgi:hypothetical protein